MPYDLGDTVRVTASCTDAGGTLANAVGAAVTITLPDGTSATPAVTNPPTVTGQYTVDYETAQAGRHLVRWVFTTPACAYTDVFDVRAAAPALLLSLADAKAQLNITTSTHDDELRGWIESVTAGVEVLCGPVALRAVTEKHDPPGLGVRQLALSQTPAVAVTAVTAVRTGSTAPAVADLDLDGPTGIVERLDGGLMYGPLRVAYTAGRTDVPATIRSAALIILRHLWRTQQGPGRPAPGGDDYSVSEPVPGFGYAIPNRALQLLEPERLPPGVG